MKIFEFEFTIDELIDIVNLVQNLKNKEEKHLCLVLYLSTELLQDWYNEINKIFSPVLDKKGIRNLTDDERDKVYVFTGQIAYVPINDTLLKYLDQVMYDYQNKTNENEKEHHKLHEIIKNEDDYVEIERIRSSLFRFSDQGSKTKTNWIKDISNSDDWDVTASTVFNWKNELKEIALNAHNARLDLTLNCNQNYLRNIVKRYRNERKIE